MTLEESRWYAVVRLMVRVLNMVRGSTLDSTRHPKPYAAQQERGVLRVVRLWYAGCKRTKTHPPIGVWYGYT